jgi:HD-like signal output (HDOD) protein/prolyl-tRNA editing enzyme YbaK/EbsC (Cys-tRNA(Pro) deacylase)
MGLPKKVQAVLDEWNVEYRVSPITPITSQPTVSNMPRTPENSAQLSILEDEHGRIQVIFPAKNILDLNKLQALTSRQLTPCSQDKIDAIRRSLNLQSIPALPQVTGLETYVDKGLLDYDNISIEISEDQLLEIPKDAFQSLVESAHVGEYCASIPKIELPQQQWSQQDTPQIINAVQNFTTRRIHQRLEETLDMPPMPETAQRIIDLRMDPDAESDELAKLVGRDPGLAAQVISWANSPYYGIAGTIANVEEAVIRVLGFDLVINLALGLSLGRTLSVPKDGPQGYAPFWQQSVCTAAMMAELVRALPAKERPSQGMAYLCGLLHNFGFLLLGHVFPPHAKLVNRHIEANPQINRYYIEQHLMGITREQISSNLFKQWGLPDEVCTAIRYQNEPDYDGEHSMLSKMLYVSSRLLSEQKLNDAPLELICHKLKSSLNIDMDKAQAGLEKVMDSQEELQKMARQLKG